MTRKLQSVYALCSSQCNSEITYAVYSTKKVAEHYKAILAKEWNHENWYIKEYTLMRK